MRSSHHAAFLHNDVPGITAPAPIRHTLATLDDASVNRYGIEAAQAFLRQTRPMSASFSPKPPFRFHQDGRGGAGGVVASLLGGSGKEGMMR